MFRFSESDRYVAHDTDTADQVNHFQNFIANLWKIMWILNFIKKFTKTILIYTFYWNYESTKYKFGVVVIPVSLL